MSGIPKALSKSKFKTMQVQMDYKIYGIVREIKETQAMIKYHDEGDDPVDAIMAEQFSIRKRKLLRELLSELALSGVSFNEIKHFIHSLTAYLEKTDQPNGTSEGLKSNLAEVEAMLVL